MLYFCATGVMCCMVAYGGVAGVLPGVFLFLRLLIKCFRLPQAGQSDTKRVQATLTTHPGVTCLITAFRQSCSHGRWGSGCL